MIDATHLKAHPTASSLWLKKGIQTVDRLIDRTKSGINTRLNAVTDQNERQLSFFMTVGQISDYTGASVLLDSLPMAQRMLANRGYDADWF